MRTYWEVLWTVLRARLEVLRREPEAGYATETVLVIAMLVVGALAVIAVIIAKVVTKANGITL